MHAPNEVVVRRVIPTPTVGLQEASHHFVYLPANQQVLLPRSGIDGHRWLFRTIECGQLVFS
jgi:hypothetical protein